MSLREQLDMSRLPSHIAIIMDGNGRWAKEQGQDRLFGHFHGVESVRNIVEGAAELGIQYLTLYAFSTENWARPKDEVDGLMELLVNTLKKEIKKYSTVHTSIQKVMLLISKDTLLMLQKTQNQCDILSIKN